MRKSYVSLRILLPVFLILLFTILLCLSGFLIAGMKPLHSISDESPVSADANTALFTRVVIDPGHGGEDGGASSASGLLEKDVNLSVSLYLRDYLEAAGIPVVMTRTEDKLLYDRKINYQGRKKQLDLNARLHTAQAVPDSLFISIHMNSFTESQYKGMQVWYSVYDPHSMEAASAVQSHAILLDAGNHRRIKASGSNIFLLDRLDTPGILTECGFLSNPDEAAKLGDDTYQKQLAFIIFTGIMSCIG